MAEKWRNWARQQSCSPTRVERPASEEQLSEALARAAREGLRVRPVGSGHSFTDTCLTDGVMVDQSGMGRVLDVDRAIGLVRVEAGIKLHRLAAELHRNGLALENQGDIDTQSLAGAMATATHGTGSASPICRPTSSAAGWSPRPARSSGSTRRATRTPGVRPGSRSGRSV